MRRKYTILSYQHLICLVDPYHATIMRRWFNQYFWLEEDDSQKCTRQSKFTWNLSFDWTFDNAMAMGNAELSVEQWLTFVVTLSLLSVKTQCSSYAIAAPATHRWGSHKRRMVATVQGVRWVEALYTLMMPRLTSYCLVPGLLLVVAWCLGVLPGYQTSLVTI